MRQAFSRKDHISTPQINPAKRFVRCNSINPSSSVSIINAMQSAIIENPNFSIVRHASRLSKYHACPMRRASACEAITPVMKSKPINPMSDQIIGTTGEKSAANAATHPLMYLHNASITTTAFKNVLLWVILGHRGGVGIEITRHATA